MYLKASQMATLAILSLIALIADYFGIQGYISKNDYVKIGSLSQMTLLMRLPFYFMLKIALQNLFTHLLSSIILERHLLLS